VQSICGPGAVWPQLTRDEIAKEVGLEVEAGSTGKPNQAQEIANAEKIIPLVLQVPGVNPEWVLQQLIHRLDDSIDMTQAFSQGMPSIAALNAGMPLMPPQQGQLPPPNGGGGPPPTAWHGRRAVQPARRERHRSGQ
jgi:hypothetical protein